MTSPRKAKKGLVEARQKSQTSHGACGEENTALRVPKSEVTSSLAAQCRTRGESGVGTRGPERKETPHRDSIVLNGFPVLKLRLRTGNPELNLVYKHSFFSAKRRRSG
ncbi:hypothetical protein Bbelb_383030 [Branchiostoma belcheri]|nr:hypothetical protein Bbelb_383030 [Branchiostoma belcheri]